MASCPLHQSPRAARVRSNPERNRRRKDIKIMTPTRPRRGGIAGARVTLVRIHVVIVNDVGCVVGRTHRKPPGKRKDRWSDLLVSRLRVWRTAGFRSLKRCGIMPRSLSCVPRFVLFCIVSGDEAESCNGRRRRGRWMDYRSIKSTGHRSDQSTGTTSQGERAC